MKAIENFLVQVAALIFGTVFLSILSINKPEKNNVIYEVIYFVLVLFLIIITTYLIIKLYKLGILNIYSNREKAYNRIRKDIINSDNIYVISFKGQFLINKTYDKSNLKEIVDKKHANAIKVLLLDPDSSKYISLRSKELEKTMPGRFNHSKEILQSINLFQEINNSGNIKTKIEYKVFSERLKWSILISAKYVLVGFYASGRSVKDSICLKIKRHSILGESFEKYFYDIWDNFSKEYRNKNNNNKKNSNKKNNNV